MRTDGPVTGDKLVLIDGQELAELMIDYDLGVSTIEATSLPTNLSPKHGEELREWLRDFLEHFAVEWMEFTHEETEVADELAYHRYAYGWRVTPRSGGPSTGAHGKGLHILRRRPNEDWKIVCEIWNASPSPESR